MNLLEAIHEAEEMTGLMVTSDNPESIKTLPSELKELSKSYIIRKEVKEVIRFFSRTHMSYDKRTKLYEVWKDGKLLKASENLESLRLS